MHNLETESKRTNLCKGERGRDSFQGQEGSWSLGIGEILTGDKKEADANGDIERIPICLFLFIKKEARSSAKKVISSKM